MRVFFNKLENLNLESKVGFSSIKIGNDILVGNKSVTIPI